MKSLPGPPDSIPTVPSCGARSEKPASSRQKPFGASLLEINVGGKVYKASFATLRRSTFLSHLLSDELSDDLKDDGGRLFIDRDPDLFGEVLRLLRGYPSRCAPETAFAWTDIKHEADFYQIPVEMMVQPVEVILPPDVLCVRRLYSEGTTPSGVEPLHRDEICMYAMGDLPQDLRSQTRIVAVEVLQPGSASKTVFAIGQRMLEESGFFSHSQNGVWERTERRCYHRVTPHVQVIIPTHPMELCRETHEHYICVTYCIPPVGNIVSTGEGGVVGIVNK